MNSNIFLAKVIQILPKVERHEKNISENIEFSRTKFFVKPELVHYLKTLAI